MARLVGWGGVGLGGGSCRAGLGSCGVHWFPLRCRYGPSWAMKESLDGVPRSGDSSWEGAPGRDCL